jgi:hypothetical protein
MPSGQRALRKLNLMKIGAGVSSRITGAQRGGLVYKKENSATLRHYRALRAKDPAELRHLGFDGMDRDGREG